MVSLFTIVSVALSLTASGVFGQCPPNLTGLVTNGINIGSFERGFQWGPLTAPATAGLPVTGQSIFGSAPTFIIKPDPVITTTFTISDFNNTNLLVTNIGNQLFYEPASTTGVNPANQQWDISCLTCATPEGQAVPGGSFCTVQSHGTNNCVQNEESSPADSLPVTPCSASETEDLVFVNPS